MYDEAAGTVTTTYSDGTVYASKDYVTDEKGLIVSWSDAAGVSIEQRLLTQNSTGSGAGQTVTVTSAFRQGNGDLVINVDVESTGSGSPDWRPRYVGPDGVAREPVDMMAPSDLTPGAVTKVGYYFEDADFGGTLTYEAWNDDTNGSAEITLPIR